MFQILNHSQQLMVTLKPRYSKELLNPSVAQSSCKLGRYFLLSSFPCIWCERLTWNITFVIVTKLLFIVTLVCLVERENHFTCYYQITNIDIHVSWEKGLESLVQVGNRGFYLEILGLSKGSSEFWPFLSQVCDLSVSQLDQIQNGDQGPPGPRGAH